MRHKYETRGIVLSRAAVGEANTLVTMLTRELGLVRARAQGLRRSGAKLAAALATLAESEAVLVRGKEHWRLAGAVLQEGWFAKLTDRTERERAGRITTLLLRIVGSEMGESDLYDILIGFLHALAEAPRDLHDAAEILAALRIVRSLGFDDGEALGGANDFSTELLARVAAERSAYVLRVNRGISASGL